MGEKQQPKQKKIPVRRCCGCGEHKEKRSLLRVVRPPEESGEAICLDPTGKKNGRGAYVCPSGECLKKARKRNALSHAFKCRVPDEIYSRLEEQLAAMNTPDETEERGVNA
ncbi:MAG: YlxR family protein [Clostridium sp.]|nr:YlxR family protein [Clostridium sp.]